MSSTRLRSLHLQDQQDPELTMHSSLPASGGDPTPAFARVTGRERRGLLVRLRAQAPLRARNTHVRTHARRTSEWSRGSIAAASPIEPNDNGHEMSRPGPASKP